MPRMKIAVSLEPETLKELDRFVRFSGFANRSRAIDGAVKLASKMERRIRLLRELEKLDPKEEMALAEEFAPLIGEIWPEY